MNFACLLKIVMYPILVGITMLITNSEYNRYLIRIENGYSKTKKISIVAIVCIAVLFGLYSLRYGYFGWGDIERYDSLFSAGREIDSSTGLNWIFSILHHWTNNTDVLLFVVNFLVVSLMLLAYRVDNETNPKAILMLCCTQFFVETAQSNLKQGIACALIGIAIILFSQRRIGLAVICSVLGCCFHESALIIIPILILCIGSKNKYLNVFKTLLVIVIAIFFPIAMARFYSILGNLLPSLAEEMSSYMSSNGTLKNDSTFWIVFKGLPYYYITVKCYQYRNYLEDKISNFHFYYWLSIFSTVIYLTTIYSYWMQRFRCFFYIPLAILLSRIFDVEEEYGTLNIYKPTLWIFGILLFRFMLQWYPIFS